MLYFGFELSYGYYRRAEHLLVEEIEMRLVGLGLRLVFDDLASYRHQCAGERQGYEHRADIKDGMEHRQLELRRCRKQVLEERAEGPDTGGEQTHRSGNQQEEHDTHDVENEVDHRRPFGSYSAGQTGNNRYHARTDVATHREVDALIERHQPRDDHRDGDRGHDGRRLDDGGQDRADQH